jgi:hypothetical protein
MDPAAAANYRSYLVPGRSCGDCTACCTVLSISTEAFHKPVGVTCDNCVASGCAIYDDRPQLCRDYHCVWRSMPGLDESWRPDLSGVMIVWDTPPPGAPTEHAVDVLVIGEPALVETDRFLGLVSGFIAQGVATSMSLPRGPGHLHVTILLNGPLHAAIAARDRAGVRDMIRAACVEMLKRPPVPEPIPER